MKFILFFCFLIGSIGCANHDIHDDVVLLEKAADDYSNVRYSYTMASTEEFDCNDTSSSICREKIRRAMLQKEEAEKEMPKLYQNLVNARAKVSESQLHLLNDHELFVLTHADELIDYPPR